MILPTLTYCGILHLQLTQTQINKLSSFYDRAVKVVFKNGNLDQDHNLPSAINVNKIRACKVVRKCLNNDICEHFKDYFTLQNHGKHTRNNRHLLRLPIIKTEYARRSFYYMGAKVYNELPLEIRKAESTNDFEKQLNEHFRNP